MRTSCLALLLLLSGPTAARADEPPTPISVDAAGRLLETLVDLPTRSQRAQMAKRLADRRDAPLATWLRAMRGFGTFPAVATGNSTVEVVVPVGDDKVQLLWTSYVPPGYDPGVPSPLLLVFHGSGGDGRGDWRAWKDVADALDMLVVCPGDAIADKGYTASPRERDAAWAALRLARRRFNVDEKRIFATGVSRGGHLVWDLATRAPDRFAAIAPMIGGPRLSPAAGQNNLRYLENLVDVPIRDLQGSHDDKRLLHNLRYAFSKLERFGAKDAQLIEFKDRAHDFDLGAVDWKAFFGGARRSALPQRVIRRFATPGEGRAFYVEVLEAGPKVKEIPQLTADRRWSAMSDAERRVYMAEFVEERTARVEVTYEGPGLLEIKAADTKRVRLLLTREMLGDRGRVDVRWNGRRRKKTAKPSSTVLLAEFAERFDRGFLPVAEIKLP